MIRALCPTRLFNSETRTLLMSVFEHFFCTVKQVLHKPARQVHYADVVLLMLVHYDAALEPLETVTTSLAMNQTTDLDRVRTTS